MVHSTHTDFSARLLTWFYQHGRHDLPWQQLHRPTPDPYPVWVSEIMLQQTQVATVIGYFERFMARFPTLEALASADTDEVLTHWAGLGYYARARNLHKAAQSLKAIKDSTGAYPKTAEDWQALSGIGRSTAGAIVSMGLGGFGVICDGNVKRVLARQFAIADDLKKSSTEKTLWSLATALTPKDQSGHYAQAMMDLGATLCTKSRPACTLCPVSDSCQAFQAGIPTAYPIKTPKTPKPTHHSTALYLIHKEKALWLKRPDDGIWGGLYCLPFLSDSLPDSFDEQLIKDTLETLIRSQPCDALPSIRHTLTHFHWQLSIMPITLDDKTAATLDVMLSHANCQFGWYNKKDATALARPTAMKKLLEAASTASMTVF
ncbi:MAG: A/G-specific adenine glycosylase [Moraxella sp.]|nr:A/G-specific adenine glycosylase [Moraxella sp.]